MKVLMIGGTGLLGSAAAQIFVDRGNEIKTLALPPLPEGAPLPKEMEIVFQDANKLTDDEMIEMMKGYDMFVFATGVDERVEFPAPVYDYYYKYNIAPLERYLPLAKKAGMKGAVVCGSYFAWLAKERPDMKLTENLKAVLGEGGSNHALFVFEVMVPDRVDIGRLRRELIKEGSMHNLRVGVQHRDIFEAMHRIVSV